MLTIPMPILGALVIGGVTLVVVLTRVLGFSTRARIAGLEDARERFLRDLPEETVTDGMVADDGASALLALEGGRVGALFVLGDQTTSRVLTAAAIRDVTKSPGGLRVRLRDPGAPRVDVALRDPAVVARWAACLKGAVDTPGSNGG